MLKTSSGKKTMLHQRFQQRIKELRMEKGLTQADVARELGIKQPVYADMETGPSEPRLSTLERLAEVFGVDPSDLITEKVFA